MESRFAHDFSQVRIHTDAAAAASADAIDAHAYSAGHHLVFNHGRYTPSTAAGRRLLAHELAHVVQSPSGLPAGPAVPLSTDSGVEDAAHGMADAALSGSFRPPHEAIQPQRAAIHRWSISGNTAVSDDDSDTLGRLAQRAGARFNDWKCIRPLRMQTHESGKAPAGFDARYELYVQKGDRFDISNLKETTGEIVRMYLFDDSTEAMDASLAKRFYAGSAHTSDADVDLEAASGGGSKPIGDFVIFGHSGGGDMWGSGSRFTPADFDPEDPTQTFALAEAGLFPRRCWFTRNATARLVGCNSDAVGQAFAGHYLRRGSQVITTTESVRPRCTAAVQDQFGNCRVYNGVDFASSPSRFATSLDGPFWTRGAFHGGKFWKAIKGKL